MLVGDLPVARVFPRKQSPRERMGLDEAQECVDRVPHALHTGALGEDSRGHVVQQLRALSLE